MTLEKNTSRILKKQYFMYLKMQHKVKNINMIFLVLL